MTFARFLHGFCRFRLPWLAKDTCSKPPPVNVWIPTQHLGVSFLELVHFFWRLFYGKTTRTTAKKGRSSLKRRQTPPNTWGSTLNRNDKPILPFAKRPLENIKNSSDRSPLNPRGENNKNNSQPNGSIHLTSRDRPKNGRPSARSSAAACRRAARFGTSPAPRAALA